MVDPLSQFITLLQPKAIFSKGISGAGRWGVRYSSFGKPSFCAVLEGSCRLSVDGEKPTVLEEGDFVLLPATPGFTMSSFHAVMPVLLDPGSASSSIAEVRHGTKGRPPDVRLLGGYFEFESPDAHLVVSLLPSMVHAKAVERLCTLVRLVAEETSAARSGRELILERLVEILLIEALRTVSGQDAPPGLLRALADPRLAPAIRLMHARAGRRVTVAQLAKAAGVSRSVFFERFVQTVGVTPMDYLLAWRMALARQLLRREGLSIGEVAERVGYASSSTFSMAFGRHVGLSPGRYARGG